MTTKVSIIAGATLALASQARADSAYPTTDKDTTTTTTRGEPGVYSYAWHEPRLRSDIGVGITLGGGITGFTDSAMRDVISQNVGGLWDVRAAIGTHIPLGVEVGYLGTAAKLQTLGGTDNGTLIGTTAEGALRYNILPHSAWNPYAFAGMGWQRYDVVNAKLAMADTGMSKTDNVLEFPMGAGISYRDSNGLVVDVRGTFRAATNNDLLKEPNGNEAQLHSWEASGALGYEF